jgi:hypothetical protein
MYASPPRLPQPGALLNSYGLVVGVISGIKLDSYRFDWIIYNVAGKSQE